MWTGGESNPESSIVKFGFITHPARAIIVARADKINLNN